MNVKEVSDVFRKEMGFRYRKVRKTVPGANSERCLVLRQQYALKMISLLLEGKRIINVDETWINETNFTRKAWCSTQSSGTVPLKAVQPALAMITSLDSDGHIHFALSHSNTD